MDCNLQSTRKSFIEDTASVTGSHPSTIARHIKISTDLTPEAKETLRGAKKPVSKVNEVIQSQEVLQMAMEEGRLLSHPLRK